MYLFYEAGGFWEVFSSLNGSIPPPGRMVFAMRLPPLAGGLRRCASGYSPAPRWGVSVDVLGGFGCCGAGRRGLHAAIHAAGAVGHHRGGFVLAACHFARGGHRLFIDFLVVHVLAIAAGKQRDRGGQGGQNEGGFHRLHGFHEKNSHLKCKGWIYSMKSKIQISKFKV